MYPEDQDVLVTIKSLQVQISSTISDNDLFRIRTGELLLLTNEDIKSYKKQLVKISKLLDLARLTTNRTLAINKFYA